MYGLMHSNLSWSNIITCPLPLHQAIAVSPESSFAICQIQLGYFLSTVPLALGNWEFIELNIDSCPVLRLIAYANGLYHFFINISGKLTKMHC